MRRTDGEIATADRVASLAAALLAEANDELGLVPLYDSDELDTMFRWALFELESRGLLKWPDESPVIVCLCGSTRFGDAFQEANLRETLAGRIVLSIGCTVREDDSFFAVLGYTPTEVLAVKERLDELHKRKIDLADEVLVLNVDGYIGESTRSEIDYAESRGKRIRYLEQLHGLLDGNVHFEAGAGEGVTK